MKSITWLGVVLLLLGLFVLAYPVISYTKTEKVVDFGPVAVTHEKREHVPMPPMLGGAAAIAGLVLLVAGNRGR